MNEHIKVTVIVGDSVRQPHCFPTEEAALDYIKACLPFVLEGEMIVDSITRCNKVVI